MRTNSPNLACWHAVSIWLFNVFCYFFSLLLQFNNWVAYHLTCCSPGLFCCFCFVFLSLLIVCFSWSIRFFWQLWPLLSPFSPLVFSLPSSSAAAAAASSSSSAAASSASVLSAALAISTLLQLCAYLLWPPFAIFWVMQIKVLITVNPLFTWCIYWTWLILMRAEYSFAIFICSFISSCIPCPLLFLHMKSPLSHNFPYM